MSAQDRYHRRKLKERVTDMGSMTGRDRARLDKLETIVGEGLETFIQVGAALKEIRDDRLYRGTHKTFDEYLQRKWKISRSYAGRLISAAEVVNNIADTKNVTEDLDKTEASSQSNCVAGIWKPDPTKNPPRNEAQTRELARLPANKQKQAWKTALVKSFDSGRTSTPTAKDVKVVVDEMTGKNDLQIGPTLAECIAGIRRDAKAWLACCPPDKTSEFISAVKNLADEMETWQG